MNSTGRSRKAVSTHRSIPAGPDSCTRVSTPATTDAPNIERALQERIKELNCIYSVSQLGHAGLRSVDELLQHVVNLVPAGWQFPETTCAQIRLRDLTYSCSDAEVTQWKQEARLQVDGQSVGVLTVFYRKPHPPADEGPFLREERALLTALALVVSSLIDGLTANLDLSRAKQRLAADEKALEERSTALHVILETIAEERRKISEDIDENIGTVIAPILHRLATRVPEQRSLVSLLESSLQEITSPLVRHLARNFQGLSVTEIQICHMIRAGLGSKEIARMRNISVTTVHRHREHIRRKLQLTNSNVNLATYLQNALTHQD